MDNKPKSAFELGVYLGSTLFIVEDEYIFETTVKDIQYPYISITYKDNMQSLYVDINNDKILASGDFDRTDAVNISDIGKYAFVNRKDAENDISNKSKDRLKFKTLYVLFNDNVIKAIINRYHSYRHFGEMVADYSRGIPDNVGIGYIPDKTKPYTAKMVYVDFLMEYYGKFFFATEEDAVTQLLRNNIGNYMHIITEYVIIHGVYCISDIKNGNIYLVNSITGTDNKVMPVSDYGHTLFLSSDDLNNEIARQSSCYNQNELIRVYFVEYNTIHADHFAVVDRLMTRGEYDKHVKMVLNHDILEYMYLNKMDAIIMQNDLNSVKDALETLDIPNIGKTMYVLDDGIRKEAIVLNRLFYKIIVDTHNNGIKIYSPLDIGESIFLAEDDFNKITIEYLKAKKAVKKKEDSILKTLKGKRKNGEPIYVISSDFYSIKEWMRYTVQDNKVILCETYPEEVEDGIVLKDLNRIFFTLEDAEKLVVEKIADRLLKRVNADGSIKVSYILGDDGKIYDAYFDKIDQDNCLRFTLANNTTTTLFISYSYKNFFRVVFNTKREAKIASSLTESKPESMDITVSKIFNKFDASVRIKDVQKIFDDICKDGFEIGTHNGNFYIKNPNMGDASVRQCVYAEIPISNKLGEQNTPTNLIDILKYGTPVYILANQIEPSCACNIAIPFYPFIIDSDRARLQHSNRDDDIVLTSEFGIKYTIRNDYIFEVESKDLNSKFFLTREDAHMYFDKNYRK